MRRNGVDNLGDASPSVVIPLLEAAQDEGRDELLDLWAKLLSAAADPKRSRGYRREFVGIIKQLEPIDAAILQVMAKNPPRPLAYPELAQLVRCSNDQAEISVRNLKNLDLSTREAGNTAFPTVLARQIVELLS